VIKKQKLEEGEVICSNCNGSGFSRYNDNFVGYDVCRKCDGEGKLNWIDNILGKINPTSSSSFSINTSTIASTEYKLKHNWQIETVEKMAKLFAEDIDKELISYLEEQCGEDLNKIKKGGLQFGN
jgi:DnaJ-class molecular chaperone